MERFFARIDMHDGWIFTGTSVDPVDDAKDNFEPGLYGMVEVEQSDDTLGRD